MRTPVSFRSASLRIRCAATLLALAGGLAAPAAALAQQPGVVVGSQGTASAPAYDAPVITGFDAVQAKRLTPGTAIRFTLTGTPGGTAQINVGGTSGNYYLNEVSPGVYEGSYTVRQADRFTAQTGVTANLRVGNRVATTTLNESLLAGAAWKPGVAATVPAIDNLTVTAPPTLGPGADIRFAMQATPGGNASVRVQGVQGRVFLNEVQPGRYEGHYVVSERDRIAGNANVTGTLQLGNRSASNTQRNTLASAAVAQPVQAVRCLSCGTVEAITPVEVAGNGGYLGMIAGGVAGAVLGNQVGKGTGRTAATILGAAGGAYGGKQIEGRVRKDTHYEVLVRLEGGGTQTVTFPQQPNVGVGQRVRVEGGSLVAI